jgi:hypothetical protein
MNKMVLCVRRFLVCEPRNRRIFAFGTTGLAEMPLSYRYHVVSGVEQAALNDD